MHQRNNPQWTILQRIVNISVINCCKWLKLSLDFNFAVRHTRKCVGRCRQEYGGHLACPQCVNDLTWNVNRSGKQWSVANFGSRNVTGLLTHPLYISSSRWRCIMYLRVGREGRPKENDHHMQKTFSGIFSKKIIVFSYMYHSSLYLWVNLVTVSVSHHTNVFSSPSL